MLAAPSLLRLFALGTLASMGPTFAQSAVQPPVALVPAPKKAAWNGERFTWTTDCVIYFDETEACSLAAHGGVLSQELYWLTGARLRVADSKTLDRSSRAASIRLALDLDLPEGAYRLQVTPGGVVVRGRGVHEVACGTSVFLQLMDGPGPEAGSYSVHCATIEDQPDAGFRAVMIDVARHPHSISVLEDVIRLARLYRLRYVHLHLTDNQHFTFPFEPVTSKLKGNFSYPRGELLELVRYADARGITLIPEIDLPGHSRRLVESGFLEGAASDADVASAGSAKGVAALLGDVMDVFDSSPYLHIGGDESGAGEELVPFLERIHGTVSARGKRLIVWEGFHGAPTESLPPTGEERILVAAWESSYNAPWDLLSAGYELINASWRPMYIVGGDTRLHPGSSGGRKWAPREMATWSKDRFMHWEPGRPVFEDRGPLDENLDDGIWDVPTAEWRDQILGGQICVWEQRESSVIRDLRWRLPVLSSRLWNQEDVAPGALMGLVEEVDQRIFSLVQPLEVRVANEAASGGTASLFRLYSGDSGQLSVVARRSGGAASLDDVSIRAEARGAQPSPTWIDFPTVAVPGADSPIFDHEATYGDGAAVAVRAFGPDGAPIAGATWTHVLGWAQRVRVTEFDIGRRPSEVVPDFDELPPAALLGTFEMPFLRGPLTHTRVLGQRLESDLRVPEDGEYTLWMKTQSGRASLWVDVDLDGVFGEDEQLVANTPTTEERVQARAPVALKAGTAYPLRVDHGTALPRPVLIVEIEGPGIPAANGRPRAEITPYLSLPQKER